MARIRTIKPEFWGDEKLSTLPPIDRLVFLGLISQADDAGRIVDNHKTIDGLLFPATDDSSRESLDSLARLSRIIRYKSASGQKLIQIAHWSKHQKVDHPSMYNLPGQVDTPCPGDDNGEGVESGSRDSREDVAKGSRDSRASTIYHLPSTNDLLPTTFTSEPGGPDPEASPQVLESGQAPATTDNEEGAGSATAEVAPSETKMLRSPRTIEDMPPECRQILQERWLPHAQMPAKASEGSRALFTILNTIRQLRDLDGLEWPEVAAIVEYGARHWVPAGYMGSPAKLRSPTAKDPTVMCWEEIQRQMRMFPNGRAHANGNGHAKPGKFLPNDPGRIYPRDEDSYRPPPQEVPA